MSNPTPQNTYGQYRLREIVKSQNIWGITFSMNTHQELCKFKNVKFTISVSGGQIILTSGIDISVLKRQIGQYDLEEFQDA